MSAVTGSMYAGLVNIRLHCGLKSYTAFYEYGYVYGGLLALGYCRGQRQVHELQAGDHLCHADHKG